MTHENTVIETVIPAQKTELVDQSQAIAVSPYIAMMNKCVEQGNIDNIGKIMDYQDRWEAKQAKAEFTDAMARFQSICPEIPKTKQAYNYKYAPLEDIVSFIKKPLSDCGLAYTWETVQENSLVTVTCIISHVAGHSQNNSLTAPPDTSGSKNSVMANMSTVSYLRRYSLTNGLGISTADEDKETRIDPGVTNGRDWSLEIMNCTSVEQLMIIYRKAQKAGNLDEIRDLLTDRKAAIKTGAK